jgi:hypothetical protein
MKLFINQIPIKVQMNHTLQVLYIYIYIYIYVCMYVCMHKQIIIVIIIIKKLESTFYKYKYKVRM